MTYDEVATQVAEQFDAFFPHQLVQMARSAYVTENELVPWMERTKEIFP